MSALFMQLVVTSTTAKALAEGVKYFGVSWYEHYKKWQVKYKSIHMGYYEDQHDAARAYNNAATFALDTRCAACAPCPMPHIPCTLSSTHAVASTLFEEVGCTSSPQRSTQSCKRCEVCWLLHQKPCHHDGHLPGQATLQIKQLHEAQIKMLHLYSSRP